MPAQHINLTSLPAPYHALDAVGISIAWISSEDARVPLIQGRRVIDVIHINLKLC